MFLAGAHASPVHEPPGAKGMGTMEFPDRFRIAVGLGGARRVVAFLGRKQGPVGETGPAARVRRIDT